MKTKVTQTLGGIKIVLALNGKYYLKSKCMLLTTGMHKNEWVKMSHAKRLYTPDNSLYYVYSYSREPLFKVLNSSLFVNKEIIERYDMITTQDRPDHFCLKTNCQLAFFRIDGEFVQKYVSPANRHNLIYSERYHLYFMSQLVAEQMGYVYDDEEDDWVKPEDIVDVLMGESQSKQNAPYHGLNRKYIVPPSYKGFTIGFEIEKEDATEVKKYYRPIYEATGWCKERDGSLDSFGFELISPAMPMGDAMLIYDHFDKHIELINAKGSSNCGGHISVGHTSMTPFEIYKGVTQFFPLLYSMYSKRMSNVYCEADRDRNYTSTRDKKKAIYIKSNIVEFRIFPFVENIKQLKWRYRLIRLMFANYGCSSIDVLKMILNKKSVMYLLLSEIYDDAQILEKAHLFCKYSKQFNEIIIPEKIKIQFKN